MNFEWDEAKNRSNFAKHGLDFNNAERVLIGPFVSFLDSRFDYGELRLISLGWLVESLSSSTRRAATTRRGLSP
jgi:uncharacterized DUF497 family protein